MNKLVIIIFILVFVVACSTRTSKTKDDLAATPDTIQTVLHVERMTCDHCEMTVEGSVKELAGIVSVKADFEDSTTVVKYDASKVSLATISGAIENKGYKVVGEIK